MRKIRIFVLALLALLQAFSLLNAHAQENSVTALSLNVEGPLTPALAEYLERGLAAAQQQNAELVIVQLNTPGGSVELMTRMVEGEGFNLSSRDIEQALIDAWYDEPSTDERFRAAEGALEILTG